jgi:hypothetical protein
MAAPTEGQNIKKTLANGEPSTHDPKSLLGSPRFELACYGKKVLWLWQITIGPSTVGWETQVASWQPRSL